MDEIIREDFVVLNIDCSHKAEVIKTLVSHLETNNIIFDRDAFLDVVLKREEIFPTSIGKGVAIPHGISEYVLKPRICIGRLKEPLLWDIEKQEYVLLVILIAIPLHNENNIHLKIISHLMRHLMHDEVIDRLLVSTDKEIISLLKKGLNE